MHSIAWLFYLIKFLVNYKVVYFYLLYMSNKSSNYYGKLESYVTVYHLPLKILELNLGLYFIE